MQKIELSLAYRRLCNSPFVHSAIRAIIEFSLAKDVNMDKLAVNIKAIQSYYNNPDVDLTGNLISVDLNIDLASFGKRTAEVWCAFFKGNGCIEGSHRNTLVRMTTLRSSKCTYSGIPIIVEVAFFTEFGSTRRVFELLGNDRTSFCKIANDIMMEIAR